MTRRNDNGSQGQLPLDLQGAGPAIADPRSPTAKPGAKGPRTQRPQGDSRDISVLTSPVVDGSKESANQMPTDVRASPIPRATVGSDEIIDPASLVSAFEVDLGISTGVDRVVLDKDG